MVYVEQPADFYRRIREHESAIDFDRVTVIRIPSEYLSVVEEYYIQK